MTAKISVLRLRLSYPQYLSSAQGRLPLGKPLNYMRGLWPKYKATKSTLRGQASVCEAFSFLYDICAKPGLPVIGLASQWQTQPLCERPNLSVRGQAILWEAQALCDYYFFRGPDSLWKAKLLCKMSGLSVRDPSSLWTAHPPFDDCFIFERPLFSLIIPNILWEALCLCERPSLVMKCQAALWEARCHWERLGRL